MGENLSPETVQRIMRQLKDLMTTPAEGIRVKVNEENITDVVAELDGPTDTPFEGGMFKMRLSLPTDYPNNPPKGFFCDEDFSSKYSTTEWGDLREHVEAGLATDARVATHFDGDSLLVNRAVSRKCVE
mmetsp:Transcript_7272/g.26561  ORF Transcript_7272/g.26561 Transcript_7272/m.26561 type:complete len:129 (+) Transcript_7272:245-631(+)